MSLNAAHSPAAGFTLIEVVIASALMALILVSAYACLSAGYASQKIVEPRGEILQNARVAMALMSADLRAACPLSGDSEFTGTTRSAEDVQADSVDFATHNYTPKHPQEGDYCEESFYVDKDAKTGHWSLYRRRNPRIALDPLAGGSREEIAQGVRGFKLEYYDGLDWYDNWGEVKSASKQQTSQRESSNLSGLPNAVRITLYLDANTRRNSAPSTKSPEPPLAFQTVARINLAEASQAAASGSASGSDNGQDNSQGNGSTANPGNN